MFNHKPLAGLVIIAVMGWALISSASAQDAQRDRERGSRRGGDDRQRSDRGRESRQGGDDRSRRDWRGRGGPREFTPEERERFYDEMVNRYMDRLTSTYELNNQQQTQVRSRLEEIKAQHKTYMEGRSKELETFRNQMRELREKAEAGGDFDWQQARQIGEQMRGVFEQSPLMNRESVVGEVEKLLPPEQVEKGRARRAQEEAEHQRRHEEMRQQWEQRRRERGDQPPSDGESMRDRWRRRGEWRNDHERQDESQNQPQGAEGGQAEPQPTQPQPLVENPIGPWDRYVRDFTRKYRLDSAQQATAQSILREMHERRVSYEQTHRVEYEAARAIEDDEQQERRLAELNRPIEGLFGQLKTRLERIPTAEQRRAAGEVLSASRPAAASQPAATSRPAAP